MLQKLHFERHSSSSHWNLTPSRISIWTPNLKVPILSNMYVCMYVFILIIWNRFLLKVLIHLVIQIQKKKEKIFPSCPNFILSTSWLLDLFNFIRRKRFFFTYLHIGVGFHIQVIGHKYVGDSGLNCPWFQGWYKSSKFIGMHPWAKKDLIRSHSNGWPIHLSLGEFTGKNRRTTCNEK